MLDSLFNPKSVAIVGASENPAKIGYIILKNLKDAGYKGKIYPINIRSAGKEIYGELCYASVKDCPEEIDVAVFAIPAKLCSSTIDDCIINKTKNVCIISAGFAEIGRDDLQNEVAKKCIDNNINLVGPNCLGYISTYNNLNTSFASSYPEKGNIAFISQSGAYCSALLDWAKQRGIGFSYFLSIGNKIVLGEDKILDALKNDENTNAFVFYLESLKDGKNFFRILKEVTPKKHCIILEPGRSKKAQSASKSHTGSLAPNNRVLEIAIEKSGAIQTRETREMFGLLEILELSNTHNYDGGFAILTNGGGVGVVTTDLCEDCGLNLAKPSEETEKKLKEVIPIEGSANNPFDVLGDANQDRYEKTLSILCESNEYNNILIIFTPQKVVESKVLAETILKYVKKYKNINIYTSFIGGEYIKAGKDYLTENKVITYEYPDDCVKLIGLLNKQKKTIKSKILDIKPNPVPENIINGIKKAKEENLASLKQETINMIMDYYKINYPKSENFTDKNEAMKFCDSLFPKKLVLKISSPDVIHKNDMQGVYLDIDNQDKFNKAWDELNETIKKYEIKNASILIQEMIGKSVETIIGVNDDPNFGKVMVFGSGGIYTEIIQDTSIRILPTNDFDDMMKETKVGKILQGVRGEKPKAIDKLIDTFIKIQQLVYDIPEIVSIDANPTLVTDENATVVDFKVLLK